MKYLLKLFSLLLLFSIGCTATRSVKHKEQSTDKTRTDLVITTASTGTAATVTDSSTVLHRDSQSLTVSTTAGHDIVIEEHFIPIRLPTGEVSPILSSRITKESGRSSTTSTAASGSNTRRQTAVKSGATTGTANSNLTDKSKYNKSSVSETVEKKPPNYLIGLIIIVVVLGLVFLITRFI
jgi:hypothetical protein